MIFASLALLLALGLSQVAQACPFCTSVAQTFGEEMKSMQIVVFAQLEQAPDVPAAEADDPNAPLPKAVFRVTEVVKGGEWVEVGKTIEVLFFGEATKGRNYLIMGTDAPQVMWSTPLGLSERAYDYVKQVPSLPEGPERLEFFQDYLEDEDEMLARDAYDEFAKTPYDGVKALKDKMKHDRLIEFIKDVDVPASRRRLYFVMLGVCGTPEDAPLLREMMNSEDRKLKAGLDSMLACYLILTKQQGLAEVEELFLKNADAEYADTYAAIMAIRFHGNDTDVIPKSDLVKSLRHMLDRPQLADLVIPDLARWEDWEVMPKMVELFKQADEQSSWVRVPVINYLRSCPLPEAKTWIEELAKIDPDAVKRAQTFFPFDAEGDGGAASQPADDKSSAVRPKSSSQQPASEPSAEQGASVNADANADAARDEFDAFPADDRLAQPAPVQPAPVQPAPIQPAPPRIASASGDVGNGLVAGRAASGEPVTAEVAGGEESDRAIWGRRPPVTEAEARATAEKRKSQVASWQPNPTTLWGVPIVSGVALMYLLRLVLGMPLFRFQT
jgi:hypothetical protein